MFIKLSHLYLKANAQQLILTLTLLGIMLACQLLYIQHGWVNNDFVLYHEAARLFSIGEWKAGFNLFKWPLYSLLIALTHQLTSLSFTAAANVLTVIFFGITSFSFLKLIQTAGGDKTAIVTGALILFGSQYIVGDVLPMLLRDPGFWGFFILSLLFLIRYCKTQSAYDAVYWQLCAITATLFRIEGFTFLVLLPLVVLLSNKATFKQRFHQYLVVNSLSLIALAFVTILISCTNLLSMKDLGRLNEVFTTNLYTELTQQLVTKAPIMAHEVLGSYLDEYAVIGLLITFAYIVLVKSISTTGIINFYLACIRRVKSQPIDKEALSIFKATAAIAIINASLIIIKVFILSSRYIVPLALVLMVIASIRLASMVEEAFKPNANSLPANRKLKWLTIVLLTIMALSLVKNLLPKSEGHSYQQDAVAWLQQANVNKQAVFYDNPRMRYYAGEDYIGRWDSDWDYLNSAINDHSIHNYHYLIFNDSNSHPERKSILKSKLPDFSEIKRFDGYRSKNAVIIFEKNLPN